VLTTAPSEFTTTTTSIPAGPVLYEIQPGDSLSSIAAEFGITLERLLIANETITDPGLIRVGQTIVVPEPPREPLEGGLEIPDPEAPDLPALTSTTTTTEPFATTAPNP
jgi:LysM repeat protein